MYIYVPTYTVRYFHKICRLAIRSINETWSAIVNNSFTLTKYTIFSVYPNVCKSVQKYSVELNRSCLRYNVPKRSREIYSMKWHHVSFQFSARNEQEKKNEIIYARQAREKLLSRKFTHARNISLLFESFGVSEFFIRLLTFTMCYAIFRTKNHDQW